MHTHINQHTTGYDVIMANTEESKKIHFNLRYQIYCLEKGYEEACKFPDELEKDEYDDRSVHFLIRHRSDHQWVGTFRLIIDKFHNLPICQYTHINYPHRLDHEKTVIELSRLAVIRSHQKLPGKMTINSDDTDLYIVFNAISACIEYSKNYGSQKIFFLCRPALARNFRKMGLKCPQIGDKAIFKGVRYPYKFDLVDFPDRLFETRHALQAFHRKNSHIHYCHASSLDKKDIEIKISSLSECVKACSANCRTSAQPHCNSHFRGEKHAPMVKLATATPSQERVTERAALG